MYTRKNLNDRFGKPTGSYFSPAKTPMPMRALPPSSNTNMYNLYEVVKPFPVQSSTIAPSFGQPLV
ncbi:MAG: TNT domain-containing protein [Flavobacteriales bacterium]